MNIYQFDTDNIEELLTGIRDNSEVLYLSLLGLHHLGHLDRKGLNGLESILTEMEGKIETILENMHPLNVKEFYGNGGRSGPVGELRYSPEG
ncbi:MAG: hypothetical protein GY754_46565 [bacterium]|nr:hypothetical protein [bacterium]